MTKRICTYSLLTLCLLCFGASAMHNPYQLTTEAELISLYQEFLPNFWRTHAIEGELQVRDGITIRYAALRQPKVDRAIIIVNGRGESYLKYQELAWDLWRQNYSLYLIDHRGQGLSDRLLADPQKGYVKHFDDYVFDLKQFHDEVITLDNPNKLFILAHSMGGAISARYLELWPNDITAAALSSPMMGINLGGLPKWLAQGLARSIDAAGSLFGQAPYSPGVGAYMDRGFTDNGLTQSKIRYRAFRQIYEQHPQIKLGGPTAHWIYEGISGAQSIIANSLMIHTPLLILQAGNDGIVDNEAQTLLYQYTSSTDKYLVSIDGAWHELLIESDKYRLPALTAVLDFFSRY